MNSLILHLLCALVLFVTPVVAGELKTNAIELPSTGQTEEVQVTSRHAVTNSPVEVVREFYRALNRNDAQPPDVFEADLESFAADCARELKLKGTSEQIVWSFFKSQRALLSPLHPPMENPFLLRVTDFPNPKVQGVLAIGSSPASRSVVRKQVLFFLHFENNHWRINPFTIHVNGSPVIPHQEDAVRAYFLGAWAKQKIKPKHIIESPKAASTR